VFAQVAIISNSAPALSIGFVPAKGTVAKVFVLVG
jgi:hypothetical protein